MQFALAGVPASTARQKDRFKQSAGVRRRSAVFRFLDPPAAPAPKLKMPAGYREVKRCLGPSA
jgi:hypothetical protein